MKRASSLVLIAITLASSGNAHAGGSTWRDALKIYHEFSKTMTDETNAAKAVVKGGSAGTMVGGAATIAAIRKRNEITAEQRADAAEKGMNAAVAVYGASGHAVPGIGSIVSTGIPVLTQGAKLNTADDLYRKTMNPNNIDVAELIRSEQRNMQNSRDVADQYQRSLQAILVAPPSDKKSQDLARIRNDIGDFISGPLRALDSLTEAALQKVADSVLPKRPERRRVGESGWRAVEASGEAVSLEENEACMALPDDGWQNKLITEIFMSYSSRAQCRMGAVEKPSNDVANYSFQCVTPRCETCVDFTTNAPSGPGTGGDKIEVHGNVFRINDDKISHVFDLYQNGRGTAHEVKYARCSLAQ